MGDFAVKFRVKSKVDGFNWALVAVYGAAQPEHKPDFLADLVRICGSEQLPILVGGDFNIIRRREEKNNDNFDGRWSFMFNTIIESLDLREIELSGRKFTWANTFPTPTFEKLDRVLASVEWEQKFPLVTVQALSRGISDHTPLHVDSGEATRMGNKNSFSFEMAWFEREGFLDLVAREWAKDAGGRTAVERWQNKLRHLRSFLCGWAKNLSGMYKVEKERLLTLIQSLDLKAESTILPATELHAKLEAKMRLKELLREEELKWALRAKVRKVVQGDANTQFFHMIANGKHRKKRIFQLEQDEGTILGQENLKLYITEYYKQLFGPPEDSCVSLDESRIEDVPQLATDENDILTAPFTEKEVFDAISQMKNNKAPGPDVPLFEKKSPASTVSRYASTPTPSSCPSSSISTGCSTPATSSPFAVAAKSRAVIQCIIPAVMIQYMAGRAGDHKPALAATGTPDFTQRKKLQQHQDLLESAAKFPKQEINGWEHPDLCSPSKLLKNVSTSIREISRWARSSTGSKVNSDIRLLDSVFSLIQVVTSTAPHPDHVVAMIRVHEALASLLLVLPKNIFLFLLQHFAQFGNALHNLRRSIRSGLQVLKNMILDYTSDVVPQGGGIHEITKYLLKYIISLLDNGRSLKIILVSDEQDGMAAMETLQDVVATLICHLEIMLQKESHRYKDAGLKQMFMVNNVNFVLHQVEGSETRYLLGEDWVLQHRDQLKDHISRFINISWESVMYCFHVKTNKIPIFSSLPTLQIFNLEFEKTYWTQKTWKVENPLLRSNMRKSVSEKLVQAYSTYHENHKNKAPKLMKYTPEDLEELLSDLCEG
nr:uncharacterized protein LOC123494946 [Aegilops tauschii subsp. strangulata]